MEVEDIRHVSIVGSGTMGQQIGFQCALHGLDVTLYDTSEDVLAGAMDRLKSDLALLVLGEMLTQSDVDRALSRMVTTSDLAAAVSSTDFISESVPEIVELKREVWGELGRLAPEYTIFTTNTSSLTPSEYAVETGRPEKFAAFHFHLPVPVNRIVDVMTHGGTSKETMDLVEGFARRINLIPIRIEKESPEYVFNAMLIAFLGAAGKLYANEVASFEDIDRAWMGIMGAAAGPFGMMDGVGLDTVCNVIGGIADKQDNEDGHKIVARIKEMVDRGELGAKSGKGFYDYPDPAFAREGFIEGK